MWSSLQRGVCSTGPAAGKPYQQILQRPAGCPFSQEQQSVQRWAGLLPSQRPAHIRQGPRPEYSSRTAAGPRDGLFCGAVLPAVLQVFLPAGPPRPRWPARLLSRCPPGSRSRPDFRSSAGPRRGPHKPDQPGGTARACRSSTKSRGAAGRSCPGKAGCRALPSGCTGCAPWWAAAPPRSPRWGSPNPR